MSGDDEKLSGQGSDRTVVQGWSISRSEGGSTTTTAGTESVTVSHGESCTGTGYPEDDRTVTVAWAETTAEDGGKIRGMLLTELARLLADAPERVTLDGVAASGNDLLLTLRVPPVLLVEVGTEGTSKHPHLVLTSKGGASEV